MPYDRILPQRVDDLTECFSARQYAPGSPGYYKVDESERVSPRSKYALVGRGWRYWDGTQWLTERDGSPSVFGKHLAHVFQGLKVQFPGPEKDGGL